MGVTPATRRDRAGRAAAARLFPSPLPLGLCLILEVSDPISSKTLWMVSMSMIRSCELEEMTHSFCYGFRTGASSVLRL